MSELLDDIVNGTIAGGSNLPSEVELVERFDVSRGVVRETLRGLEERGVIKVRHGKGAVVLDQPDWDVFDEDVMRAFVESRNRAGLLVEYLECRKVLELQAASLAAQRAGPEALRELEESFDKLAHISQSPSFRDQSSEDDYHDADIGFHRALAAASGNLPLARLVHEVHRSLLPRQILARPAKRRYEILSEHERILRAVQDHDPGEAEAAMADHLGAVEKYLTQYERRRRR